jgi:hypothetical protein
MPLMTSSLSPLPDFRLQAYSASTVANGQSVARRGDVLDGWMLMTRMDVGLTQVGAMVPASTRFPAPTHTASQNGAPTALFSLHLLLCSSSYRPTSETLFVLMLHINKAHRSSIYPTSTVVSTTLSTLRILFLAAFGVRVSLPSSCDL